MGEDSWYFEADLVSLTAQCSTIVWANEAHFQNELKF